MAAQALRVAAVAALAGAASAAAPSFVVANNAFMVRHACLQIDHINETKLGRWVGFEGDFTKGCDNDRTASHKLPCGLDILLCTLPRDALTTELPLISYPAGLTSCYAA